MTGIILVGLLIFLFGVIVGGYIERTLNK